MAPILTDLTIQDNQGILGFTKEVKEQSTPALVKGLKNIRHLACGANHVLAMDKNGNVFAWGTGQQNQLGRRVVERTRIAGLVPREFGLPKKQIKYISAGSDHSFAVDNKNNVWAWGLNNFGQCGISDNAGADDAVVAKPEIVASLSDYTMTGLKGGNHHSVGVTADGECLAWGRLDGSQTGINIPDIANTDLIKDAKGRARILKNPMQVPGIMAKHVTADSDHSIAITTSGQAYSWGLSTSYQTGLGVENDVKVATLIDNTALRGKQLNWAGAGGQYSIFTGVHGQQQQTNGVSKATETTAATTKQADGSEPNGKTKDSAEKPAAGSEPKDKEQPNGTVATEKETDGEQAEATEPKGNDKIIDTAKESAGSSEPSDKEQANGTATTDKETDGEEVEATEPKSNSKAKDKDTAKKPAQPKGKRTSNGTGAATNKEMAKTMQKLNGVLEKMPKKVQGEIKEIIREGGRVVEKGDEIRVEPKITNLRWFTNHGEI